MRTKQGYVLKTVASCSVVVPIGDEALRFNGMINLNESGALLWKTLSSGADEQELIKVLTDEYDISEETAKADVEKFVSEMRSAGLIEE